MWFLCLPGPALHAAGVRGGGDGDLQDLSGVLEPPGGRAVPREPLLHLHLPPAVRRPAAATPLPARPVQGETRECGPTGMGICFLTRAIQC